MSVHLLCDKTIESLRVENTTLRADLAKAREEVARLTREREDYREKRANEVAAAERARDEAMAALRAVWGHPKHAPLLCAVCAHVSHVLVASTGEARRALGRTDGEGA